MDAKLFYEEVNADLRKAENSVFDKFKLDNSDLVNAVKNNDPDLVAKTLNAWVNPNKEDGLERLALPYAIDNNNRLLTGMLLARKADPNVLGEDGKSPLTKAVFWENEELLFLLLDAGADVAFKNQDGTTALEEAQKNGYTRIEKILKGIKISSKTEQIKKDTATHEKMKKQAQEAQQKKEAEERTKAEQKTLALEESFKQKYFPKGDENELLALINAIEAKDSEAVRFFSKDIEDINTAYENKIPLALSVKQKNQKLSEFLMKQGADIFYQSEGETDYPIFKAAINSNQHDLIEYALNLEEDASEFLNNKEQSLSAQFLAYKDIKMFNLLMKAGADPFYGGKDGINPVKKAIEKGSIGILPILSSYKADLEHKFEGKSLLEWAIEYGRVDWINGLITEGALKNVDAKKKKRLIALAESKTDQKEEIIALLNKG